MGRKIQLLICITLLLGVSLSCKRATKGKIAGKWAMNSYSQNIDNASNSILTEIEGSNLIKTFTNFNDSSVSKKYSTVDQAEYVFNKNGTYTYKLVYYNILDSIKRTFITEETGTWDFGMGVGKFKKKERIILNIMTSKNSIFVDNVLSNESLLTYEDGANPVVWIITKSKSKTLELNSSYNYFWNTYEIGETLNSEKKIDTKISLSAK